MAETGKLHEMFGLENRVALVTGASSGIGRHLAAVFASAGASVICLARREERLASLKDEITTSGGRAELLTADLSEETDFEALAGQASAPFGAPDILLNAAGINLREPVGDVTLESWRRTLGLNLSVPFFLTRALVPGMAERGGGAVINIASLQSFRAFANSMPYGASKGGIAQLTRAMAQEWSPKGIRCNAILPGFFPTELAAPIFADPALSERNAQATAIGRNGEMRDLDGAAIFLASAASAYITGQILAVDGGYLAK